METYCGQNLKDILGEQVIVVVELPMVEAGMEIGSINLTTGEITTTQNHVQFSCNFSTDCCTNLNIPITDMDIERIEQHGYKLDQIIEEAVPQIRFAEDETAEKNYWIKRKPFTGTCTFLENDKCSIHEFKPFSCRIFPFQLRGGKDGVYTVAIHGSNLCQSVTTVSADQAQNYELLEDLLNEVQLEEKHRQKYFEQYGNQ